MTNVTQSIKNAKKAANEAKKASKLTISKFQKDVLSAKTSKEEEIETLQGKTDLELKEIEEKLRKANLEKEGKL